MNSTHKYKLAAISNRATNRRYISSPNWALLESRRHNLLLRHKPHCGRACHFARDESCYCGAVQATAIAKANSTGLTMDTRVARCRLTIWKTIWAKAGIVACPIGALKPKVDGGSHEYLSDADESV